MHLLGGELGKHPLGGVIQRRQVAVHIAQQVQRITADRDHGESPVVAGLLGPGPELIAQGLETIIEHPHPALDPP